MYGSSTSTDAIIPELQGYLSVGGSTSVTGHSSGDRTVTAKILLES